MQSSYFKVEQIIYKLNQQLSAGFIDHDLAKKIVMSTKSALLNQFQHGEFNGEYLRYSIQSILNRNFPAYTPKMKYLANMIAQCIISSLNNDNDIFNDLIFESLMTRFGSMYSSFQYYSANQSSGVNWLSLPPDIWKKVAEQLTDPQDIHRFANVCTLFLNMIRKHNILKYALAPRSIDLRLNYDDVFPLKSGYLCYDRRESYRCNYLIYFSLDFRRHKMLALNGLNFTDVNEIHIYDAHQYKNIIVVVMSDGDEGERFLCCWELFENKLISLLKTKKSCIRDEDLRFRPLNQRLLIQYDTACSFGEDVETLQHLNCSVKVKVLSGILQLNLIDNAYLVNRRGYDQKLLVLRAKNPDVLSDCVLIDNKKYFVGSTITGVVLVWEYDMLKWDYPQGIVLPRLEFPAHEGKITCMTHFNNNILITAQRKVIKFWDMQTARCVKEVVMYCDILANGLIVGEDNSLNILGDNNWEREFFISRFLYADYNPKFKYRFKENALAIAEHLCGNSVVLQSQQDKSWYQYISRKSDIYFALLPVFFVFLLLCDHYYSPRSAESARITQILGYVLFSPMLLKLIETNQQILNITIPDFTNRLRRVGNDEVIHAQPNEQGRNKKDCCSRPFKYFLNSFIPSISIVQPQPIEDDYERLIQTLREDIEAYRNAQARRPG